MKTTEERIYDLACIALDWAMDNGFEKGAIDDYIDWPTLERIVRRQIAEDWHDAILTLAAKIAAQGC